MEVQLIKAIVHILDSSGGAPVFSDRLLELGADETEYLSAHIEKAYYNDAAKACTFLPESTFPALLLETEDFVQCSKQIASLFFDVMQQNPSIPNADLFVMYCILDGMETVALLKMNYKVAFAHHYQQVEGQHYNALIKQRTILPPTSGKAEESAIVDMATGNIRLVEKKFQLDGSKDFYLSTRVLHSTQATTERVKLQAVQTAAQQAVTENYEDTQHVACEVAQIIREEAVMADGQLPVQRVKQRIQEQFPLAAPGFEQELQNSGVTVAETMVVPAARIKRMEYQSIKTESGVELKIPTSLLTEKNEYVEFINNADGTISLLVKGIMV